MDFLSSPIKKLNLMNEDYDIELLWYGFKNLSNNYLNYLVIDDQNIIDYMKNLSNKLNELQENKKYKEIYEEIYNYLIKFLKAYTEYYTKKKYYNSADTYNYNLVDTWLNRYNKIDYVIKIKLNDEYKKYKFIRDIDPSSKIIIKFIIIGVIFREKYCLEILDIYENNILEFIDIIVNDNFGKIFDLFSTRYNMQDYYDYKKIDQKYTVIKFHKFIKILKKIENL